MTRTKLINLSEFLFLHLDLEKDNYNYSLEFFFFFFFLLFRAALGAYGGSQARGQIKATTAGLHHRHSNTGSEPCLWPTPQFMAILDP